jgi:hypothetical protein
MSIIFTIKCRLFARKELLAKRNKGGFNFALESMGG